MHRLTEKLMRGFISSAKDIPSNLEGYQGILLIDMQDDFLEEIQRDEVERMITNQIEVLECAQQNNLPIILLEYRNHDATNKQLRKILSNSNYKKIVKSEDDGFLYTSLDSIVKEKGASELVFMGINASACVKRTAKGALNAGYSIVTSPDIIADPKHWRDNKSLEWYGSNGTLCPNTENLIEYLGNNNS